MMLFSLILSHDIIYYFTVKLLYFLSHSPSQLHFLFPSQISGFLVNHCHFKCFISRMERDQIKFEIFNSKFSSNSAKSV